MGRKGLGVEIRATSIRLTFKLDGKLHRPTLKLNGKPLAPTPANRKYAERMAADIKDKIRLGAFVMAEYFPDSAASEAGAAGQASTVGDLLDRWQNSLVGLENSTIKSYRVSADWWKSKLGENLAKRLKKSDILLALASKPAWSGKTRNNKMGALRQALQLAVEDEVLASNPCQSIKGFKHQKPEPDPFTQDEAEVIIAALEKFYGPEVARYFGIKFYTGLRTSESLAMRWDWIDWPRKTMTVSSAVVLGELKGTKTNTVRHIKLNSRALQLLTAQKASTFLQPHGLIVVDPRTGERWADDEPPRESYWRPCLKRLGLRYRSPYQTRHSYAAMLLMAGAVPAWAAKQMGHSVELFLSTYARWIDGGQDDREVAKLEQAMADARADAQALKIASAGDALLGAPASSVG